MNIITKEINKDSLLQSLGPYRNQTTYTVVDNHVTVVGWPEIIPSVVIGEIVWDRENMFDENAPKPDNDRKEQS